VEFPVVWVSNPEHERKGETVEGFRNSAAWIEVSREAQMFANNPHANINILMTPKESWRLTDTLNKS
jgi:hypothetical protein